MNVKHDPNRNRIDEPYAIDPFNPNPRIGSQDPREPRYIDNVGQRGGAGGLIAAAVVALILILGYLALGSGSDEPAAGPAVSPQVEEQEQTPGAAGSAD